MARDLTQSRGYRNRNPGNIDYNSANKWQGQVGIEPAPVGGRARFAVFQTHEYGIRTLAALLAVYQDRHHLNTVRGIINRWAPPSDNNNTSAYVANVARKVGVEPDAVVDVHTYEHLRPMVQAIIEQELGGNPYTGTTIDDALRLAGVIRPVATIQEAAATNTGNAAITVGAAATAAAGAAPLVQSLGGLNPWVGGMLVVAVAIGAVVWVLHNRRKAS